jgi:hypothetical protein
VRGDCQQKYDDENFLICGALAAGETRAGSPGPPGTPAKNRPGRLDFPRRGRYPERKSDKTIQIVAGKDSFMRGSVTAVGCLALLAAGAARGAGTEDFDNEPVRYRTAVGDNPVLRLQRRLDAGKARLAFEGRFGYLRSVLRELGVRESSQVLVFSKTSFQRERIGPRAPRALYFNDQVYVGYCKDGEVLEVSSADPRLGTAFYTLEQAGGKRPRFVRQNDSCLTCHASPRTQGVPGHLVRSVYPDERGLPILSASTFWTDHTSPLKERWGGWYVTGTHGKQTHMGNLVVRKGDDPEKVDNSAGMNLTSLAGRFDSSAYLAGHSDIVALMLLEHQSQGHNLLTRAAFAARQALHQEQALNREMKLPPTYTWDGTRARIEGAADPLVKYLLFCDEAKLTGPVRGTSDFAREFARTGPRDRKGRSLRDLDLRRRLFRHPCSYLIYSPSFDALPDRAREYVLKRIHDVLTGRDTSKDFAHLSASDRKAILEILLDTKPNLPAYWRGKAPAAKR